MPILRKTVDTVQIVLSHVNKFITCATGSEQTDPVRSSTEIQTSATESNQTDPGPSVTTDPVPFVIEIQNYLKEINSQFPKFKNWEDDLMSKVISSDEDIDDDILENGTQKDKTDGDKLRSIHGKLKQIKNLVNELSTTQRQSKQPERSEDQARKVSDGWLRYSVEENILVSPAIANLQLIYDVLETQLKLCLLCFAIFPENAVIKKRPLIYWWIGEGLVTKYGDKTAEEAGEEIFVKLTKKGLLHPIRKSKKSPIVDWCTMHPWIRRMLVSVATKAQFLNFNTSGKFSDDYTKSNSHRACLVSGNQGLSGNTNSNSNSSVNYNSNSNSSVNSNSNYNSNSNSNSNSTPEKLLTIFNVDVHYLSFETDLLPKFKKLVILHLGSWQNNAKHHIEVEKEEFLHGLQAEKHLRYLSLKGISRITAIPPSIVECINLEILDLRACHNLEKLPNDMWRLGKLTHLDISECYLLENMPKGLGKLSSLQVLKGFVIGHSWKHSCKLVDLVQLKKLRKLSLHIRNEANNTDARELQKSKEELQKLKDIESLRVLTISWVMVVIPSKLSNSGGGDGAASQPTTQVTTTAATMTVESLSLPPNLEKLDLRCFPQRTSPEWLKPSRLKDLKRLYIRGGELGSFEFENGKEWNVEILRLKYLKNFRMGGSYLRNAFPRLRYFEKVNCNQIETGYEKDVEWNRDEEGWDAITAEHRLLFF